ncbi:MAG: ISAs1 family transposase [Planctomycetaceae bacterium]|nr:ISAs1 family transposase [Planctomycetaceae bacterium]
MAMDGDAQGFVDGLRECFADLQDPRNEKSCDHLLFDILAVSVLSVACGADDWCDMATFANVKLDWLKTFLELPGGAPSHDTFRRVFGLLERNQFAASLFHWTKALQEATGGKLLAIDGKTLRRTFAKKSGLKALHLVTAWASDNGLTLGQIACEEKSNEITAIPQLLKLLNLKGCTVTIDAMGCQTEIVEEIRQQGAHYVLAVKDNQPTLHADLQQVFEEALNTDFTNVQHDTHTTKETAHGRTTKRTYHSIEIPRDHSQRQKWRDLRTLVIATNCVIKDEQETWETRMYISDLAPRAKSLGAAIRKHWGIENGQHWVLDVAFSEDAARQQDRNGSTNLGAIRRLIVSLLRQETTLKRGAKAKRMVCALDTHYLLKVFATAQFDA